MHVLVVGGDGFIGRSLTAALARHGHTLTVLGRQDASDAGGADAIIFAQGLKSEDQRELMSVHVDRTLELTEQLQPHRCIYLSTIDVYEDAEGPRDEESRVAPRRLLARVKWKAEQALQARFDGTGRHLTIARLGTVYGLGQGGIGPVCGIARPLLEGQSIPAERLEDSMDLVHVEDVVSCLLKVLELPSPPGILNIGSGRETPVFELASRLRDLLSLRLRDDLRGLVRKDGNPVTGVRQCISIARALGLGWIPKMKLEEGLAEIVLDGCRTFPRDL